MKEATENTERSAATWGDSGPIPGQRFDPTEAALASPVGQIAEGESASELQRATKALLDNLWIGIVDASKTHEENWREFEWQCPGARWVHEELAALSAAPAPPATGWQGTDAYQKKYALEQDIIWRISNVIDLRDRSVRDPVERAVRTALAQALLPAPSEALTTAGAES